LFAFTTFNAVSVARRQLLISDNAGARERDLGASFSTHNNSVGVSELFRAFCVRKSGAVRLQGDAHVAAFNLDFESFAADNFHICILLLYMVAWEVRQNGVHLVLIVGNLK
jgi:hypothetical protein